MNTHVNTTRIYLKQLRRPSKRGDRMVWVFRWHETDGTERQETIGNVKDLSRREAEKRLRDRQGAMDNGIVPRNRPQKVTLRELQEVLAEILPTEVKPSTAESYDLAVRQLGNLIGFETPISKVDPRTVARLRLEMERKGRSRASVRTTLASLKAIFNRARRLELHHGANPFSAQPIPRAVARPKRIFSKDEITAMVSAAATPWWKAFIQLGATTGLRRSEMLHLRWLDIDLDAKLVHVSARTANRFTVDGEEFPILEWSPKSHRDRTVPIPAETVDRLEAHRADADESAYVFLDLERLRIIRTRMVNDTLRSRFDLANNLLRDFKVIQVNAAQALEDVRWRTGTIHDLRKTFGTRAAAAVPMHVLQQLMGHQSITTTSEYYLAADERQLDQVRAVF